MVWPDGGIAQSVLDGTRWILPLKIAAGGRGSNVSACSPQGKHIRVYFQKNTSGVEECVNGDAWFRGSGVPT